MSGIKHTPGPWIVVDMGGGSHPLYVRHEYLRRGGPNLHGSAGAVAKLPSSKFHNAAANARLIAAAPCLLDALQRLSSATRRYMEERPESDAEWASDEPSVLSIVDAAIQKATGGDA